jgi:hypothetical protein
MVPLDDLFGPDLDLDAAAQDSAAEQPKRGWFWRKKKP